MTEMQKLMESAVGFDVEVHLVGRNKPFIVGRDKPFIGKCTGYTSPQNNEPEVASIYIEVEGFSCIFEITEDEIETIIIKASK